MKEHPGTFVFGLLFAFFGLAYLADLADWWDVRPAKLWPVVLIAIGIVIALTARNAGDAD